MSQNCSAAKPQYIKLLQSILLSVGVAFAAMAGLLLICSIIMTVNDLPDVVLFCMSALICLLGGFLAGFVFAKKRKEKGLLNGLISGIAVFILLFLVSLICSTEIILSALIFKMAVILISASIGGIMGVNTKPRRC